MSPTNIKLSDIFKGYDIPSELSEVCIYTTDASSADRSMTVTVTSETIIPYEVIEDFKKGVAEKYNLSSFLLKIKYINISLESIDINLYYSNLIFYVNELIRGVRHLFLDSTCEYADGVFTVHCKYGTQMLSESN